MAVVLVALSCLAAGLKTAEIKGRCHPEVLRKGMHIGTGLIALPLPWMFDSVWSMIVLATFATAAMTATRSVGWLRQRVGTVMSGVGRDSLGEIYFPVAVAVIFVLSRGEPLLYVIPVLMLTLADAAAALVGVRYGQVRYQTSGGAKSLEGSAAFFLVAFFSVHLPLLLTTRTGRAESVLIAAILALLVMMIECVAWRGIDNLLIPLGAHALLRLYLDADTRLLLFHLLVAVSLTVFALTWRRRSKLDDSALVGCALFGYAVFAVGGWSWLVGPAGFFLTQAVFWPRSSGKRTHTVLAMLSVVSPGLVWLFVHAVTAEQWLLVPFTAAFATQLTLYGMTRTGIQPNHGGKRHPMRVLVNVGLGWVVVYSVTLLVDSGYRVINTGTALDAPSVATDLGYGLLGIGLAAIVFHFAMPLIYGPPLRSAAINPTFAVLGAVASLVAGVRWLF